MNTTSQPSNIYNPIGIIQIEGNISSGKSTLTSDIANRSFGTSLVQEEIDHSFLNLFYKEPVKYGFAFQTYMLSVRLGELEKLPDHAVVDRGLFGDLVFGTASRESGNISKEEFAVYLDLLKRRWSRTKQAKVLVYLDVEPSRCLASARTRARGAELDLDIAYLELLDRTHFTLLMQWIIGDLDDLLGACPPFVILDWNKFGDSARVMNEAVKTVNDPVNSVSKIEGSVNWTSHDCTDPTDPTPRDLMIRFDTEHTKSYRRLVLDSIQQGFNVCFWTGEGPPKRTWWWS